MKEVKSFRLHDHKISTFQPLTQDLLGFGSFDNQFVLFNTKFGFAKKVDQAFDSCVSKILFLPETVS